MLLSKNGWWFTLAEVEVRVARMHWARVENKQQIFSEMVFEHETEVAAGRSRFRAGINATQNKFGCCGWITAHTLCRRWILLRNFSVQYQLLQRSRKTHIEREKLSQSSTKYVVRVLSNSRSIDMEMSAALVVGHEKRMWMKRKSGNGLHGRKLNGMLS